MSLTPSEEPCPPPPSINLWQSDTEHTVVSYAVHEPWAWVMEDIRSAHMLEVSGPADLPSSRIAAKALEEGGAALTPASLGRRRRSTARLRAGPAQATLKIELCDQSGENVVFAAHGSSAAFDGLEDKDELVRTMQRCRCEEKNLSPPSILLNWDVTREECLMLVGEKLPRLEGNDSEDIVAVLKEPMGSQGKGIYFVRTAEEIHEIVNSHRQRALDEPGFLDNLIAAKGRIPSWVLQAEVVPSLLIRERRKFHIRTYLVVVENLLSPDLLESYIYNRHEVRIAGAPVPESDTERVPEAYITNGGMSSQSDRVLLEDVEELQKRDLKDRIELFVATTFGVDLAIDIAGRIRMSAGSETNDIKKFAVAGLDLMVTEDNRIYLLEVNVNPVAPPEGICTEPFKEHLRGFLHDVADLVVGKVSAHFVTASEVIKRHTT